jgi:hypothetical protein
MSYTAALRRLKHALAPLLSNGGSAESLSFRAIFDMGH